MEPAIGLEPMNYREEEDMVTGSIIGRFNAVPATDKRSEWAAEILKEIMERSIFEYSNSELAKIIREGPEKTDPLKHLDYEGKLIAKATTEGSRRQVLAYLESH